MGEVSTDYANSLLEQLERTEKRLSVATALLERAYKYGIGHPHIRADVGTFLSSAPATGPAPHPGAGGGDDEGPCEIEYKRGYKEGSDDTARELLSGAAREGKLCEAIEDLRAALNSAFPSNQAPAAMCRVDVGGVPCGEQQPCGEHPTRDAEPTLLERIEEECDEVLQATNAGMTDPVQACVRIRQLIRSARGAR